MSKLKRIAGIVLAVLLFAILVGPFLVPVPALTETRPIQELADPDSQFLELNGLDVHLKTAGQGEPVFVLLHGFGASLYSWQAVLEPIGQLGKVIAFDRPAFGLTERPLEWQGENPYSSAAQVQLVIELLDHFDMPEAILVGNSAGGTVAMQVVLAYPERVAALILVDPAVYSGGGTPSWTRPLLATPQMRRLGPLVSRQIQQRGPELIKLAWHDPSLITPEMIERYQKPLQVENWDKALWEFTLASRPSGLPERLAEFTLPALVVTGDDDRVVPTEQSIRLAGELPQAHLVVIENAGHVPHEERPEQFIQAVQTFVQSLP